MRSDLSPQAGRGKASRHLRGAKRRPVYACCASYAGLGVRRSSESEGGSNPAFLAAAKLDCFASAFAKASADKSLAMTWRDMRSHSRDSFSSGFCISFALSPWEEGAGKAGRWLRPQRRVLNVG